MTVKQIFNTSAELDYPTVLPTLDLDFANSKTLDPRITFTRASGGSYVGADGLIKLAGVNEARFDHNPVTGESLGLLVEEAGTNLLTSSVPQEGVWTSTNNTLISNSEIAPDGTQRATLIDSDDTASVHSINLNSSLTTATTYTQTFFVKAGTTRFVQIAPSTGFALTFANFELRDDGIIGTSNVDGASIQRFPNGWYRIRVTQTSTSTVGGRMLLVLGAALTDGRLPDTSRLSCYVWGAQLEAGTFPTSYIPTVASTRTRAADVARITGTNFSSWYRQDEGTFYSDSSILRSQIKTQVVWSAEGGTFSTSLRQPQSTANQFRALVSNVFTASTGANLTDGATKAAVAYSGAQGRLQVGTAGADAAGAGTSDAITLSIGNLGGGTQLNGHIRRIVFWPKRLPNSQLITLTAV